MLAVGDVVHVVTDQRGTAQLAQLPEAQSALVALDPEDGAIVSLVGGFDFYSNKFNRVTQARRQPGSGFKPFLYSAALENGFTPASVILDMPIVLEGGRLGGELAAGEFQRRVRRPDAAARGAGALAQPGVDPHPAEHRRGCGDRSCREVRLRSAEHARAT